MRWDALVDVCSGFVFMREHSFDTIGFVMNRRKTWDTFYLFKRVICKSATDVEASKLPDVGDGVVG